MDVSEKSFTESTETVDGNQYFNCRFERCQLVYRGGELPTITGCHFQDCGWQFQGAADRTLAFMRMFYHGMGESGPKLIEGAFEAIRKPLDEPQP